MVETMMTYIDEESQVFERIINEFDFNELTEKLPKKIEKVLILATGSSLNAALTAKYFMESKGEVNVLIEEPFNFQHYGRFDSSTDLIIAISQSGKSTSTINVLKQVAEESVPRIALTSNLDSPLVDSADLAININVGEEKVGYVTKGFSGTVLNLFLLTYSIALRKGIMSIESFHNQMGALNGLVKDTERITKQSTAFFEKNKDLFLSSGRLACIGYGANLGVAKEFETKFTETVRKPSTGYELEAYMHGPYLEADDTHLLFFVTDGNVNEKRALALAEYMRKYVNGIFQITNTSEKTTDDIFNLSSSCTDELMLPLLFVIPIQVWSFLMATEMGIDLNVDPFPDFDQKLNSKII